MRFLSVCSGIEAASVAWGPLGWEAGAFSEIEPFPSAVLKHHYPKTPNLGDMTKFKEWNLGPVDLVVGGTPCQSFSIAGLRKGMDDPRGNLALVFLGLVDRTRPQWVVWENVPGVLSSWSPSPSDGPGFGWEGNAFDTFTGGLRELGYGWAWRILDAQYFGVPQRRRRVFVVGYLGDWRPPAAVLFERHSLSGNPPPGRKAGEGLAPTISARTKSGGGLGTDFDCDGGLVVGTINASGAGTQRPAGQVNELDFCVTPSMTTRTGTGNSGMDEFVVAHSLRGEGFDASEDGTGRGTPIVFTQEATPKTSKDCSQSLDSENGRRMSVQRGQQVRRLTPRECERLQGFPDDYTLIPFRGRPATDGHRYRALGNSMAVPCMAWIGKRIQAVEEIVGGRS